MIAKARCALALVLAAAFAGAGVDHQRLAHSYTREGSLIRFCYAHRKAQEEP